jgi:hypothetical protein
MPVSTGDAIVHAKSPQTRWLELEKFTIAMSPVTQLERSQPSEQLDRWL